MAHAEVNQNKKQNLIGIGWILITGACFVASTSIVRSLEGAIPAPQAAFIRFSFATAYLLPIILPRLRQGFSAEVWKLFALRAALHIIATVSFFYAMSRVPVAEISAISFLNPIVVIIGGVLLLGERLGARRIAAIGVALAGALIVLRPGFRHVDPGHLTQIGGTVAAGASYLVAKQLSGKVPARVIVAMLSLTVLIGLAPIAITYWVPPKLEHILALGLMAIFATTGHYAMTRAFIAAPLTVTQPFTFLQLIWASLIGVVVFNEPFDRWVILGGAVMIAAITYITWQEASARPKGSAPDMVQPNAKDSSDRV